MKHLASSLVLSFLVGVTMSISGAASAYADGNGNQDAVRACNEGGYQTLVGFARNGSKVMFDNAGACKAYAARGGTLYRLATTTFFVDATKATWQDTGVSIPRGATASITAMGTAVWYVPSDLTSTPNGFGTCMNEGTFTCLAPGLPFASLVGKVDNGSPFEVGSGPTTATGPGELMLGFDDNNFSDNSGGFTASITAYTPVTLPAPR